MDLVDKLNDLTRRIDTLERTSRQVLDGDDDEGRSVISAASVVLNVKHDSTTTTGLFNASEAGWDNPVQLETFGGDPVDAVSVEFTVGESGTAFVLISAEIEQRGLPDTYTAGETYTEFSGTNPDGSVMVFKANNDDYDLSGTTINPSVTLGIHTGSALTASDDVTASLSNVGQLRVDDLSASRGGTCTVTMVYTRSVTTTQYAFGRRSLTVIPL